jgi:hypothetical protein
VEPPSRHACCYDNTIFGSNVNAVRVKAVGLYGSGRRLALDGIQPHHLSHPQGSTFMKTLGLHRNIENKGLINQNIHREDKGLIIAYNDISLVPRL